MATGQDVSHSDNGLYNLTDISNSEYPEDRYREMTYTDDVYGTLDLTERDTSL